MNIGELTIADLIAIVQSDFPESLGCIIAGSQKQNSNFLRNSFSDIDLVIFDINCSDLYTRQVMIEEYRLDYNIVPLLDIHFVIVNESFDSKATLIRMMSEGVILFDTNEIVKSIQDEVKMLIGGINISTNIELKRLDSSLGKLRDYFRRELNELEMFCLVCDVVNTITALEVIKISSSYSDQLRKGRILSEQNPKIIHDLRKLMLSFIEDNDSSLFVHFIITYQNSCKRELFEDKSTELVIDILMNDQDPVGCFCREILPLIESDHILAHSYRYFSISQKKYNRLFYNDICVCFSLADANRQHVIGIFRKLLNEKFGKRIAYAVLPITQICLPEFDLELLLKLKIEISSFLVFVSKKPQRRLRSLVYACKLCRNVLNKLNISKRNAEQLNDVYMQKWIFSKDHQKGRGYDDLKSISQTKLDANRKFISENELEIQAEFRNDESDLYFNRSIYVVSEIICLNQNILFLKYMPDAIFDYLLISGTRSAKMYLVLIDEIMINLEPDEKVICISLLSENLSN